MLLVIKRQSKLLLSQPAVMEVVCLFSKQNRDFNREEGGKLPWRQSSPGCAQESSPCASLAKQKPGQAANSRLLFGVKATVALGRPSLLEQFSTVARGLQRSSGVKSIMLYTALYQEGLRKRVKWSAAMLFELIRDIFNLIKVVSTIDFGSFNYCAVMASGSTDLWWALSALAHIEEKALCLL